MRLFAREFTANRPNSAKYGIGEKRIHHRCVNSPFVQFIAFLSALLVLQPVAVADQQQTDVEQQSEARERLRQALSVACDSPAPTLSGIGQRLGARAVEIEAPPDRGMAQVKRWMLQYDNEGVLRLDFIYRQRSLQQLVLRYGLAAGDGAEVSSPMIEIMADEQCTVQRGREIVYQKGRPSFLVSVDDRLKRGSIQDPFNPPVPDAPPGAGGANQADVEAAVVVAVVDSGVDYRSPKLLPRLLRNSEGNLVGYDYWDDDAFPFDANPSRSPFYPQRHGTRIASIIAQESEVARLAVWRYPRSDPSRFGDLIDDVAASGIRIVNLSMGSKKIDQWRSLKQAIERHKDILFVVSAGNNGVDLQQQPIYPAVFEHNNLLTVTSADDSGELAQGSNWGVEAVDIMVPAEQLLTTGFADRLQQVSGSSYAAARVSALASCLLAAKPHSSGQQLKQSIIALALPGESDAAVTRHGLLSRALMLERGACRQPPDRIVELNRELWMPAVTSPVAVTSENVSETGDGVTEFKIALTAVILKDAGWRRQQVKDTIESALPLLAQCRLTAASVELLELEVPRTTRLMTEQSMQDLSSFVESDGVRLFFVEDTLREIEFGAEAIGRVNARRRPQLRDTVWMTNWVPDAAVSLAHELYHVLADSGLHKKDPDNLMAEMTRGEDYDRDHGHSYQLTDTQCGQLRNMALGNGLIKRL